MNSTRPYLLRAIYEWIVDNDLTPHLLVDANADGVQVPQAHVENGAIVLNASPSAVRDLELGNDLVTFSARFSGTPFHIRVPIDAVQAIYARENNQGIFLGDGESSVLETGGHQDQADGEQAAEPPALKRDRPPHLTIVK
jgi:stringent starvation protein B